MSFDKSESKFLLIGELAALTEISRDTLRYYERKGVLPAPIRSAKGYRLYPADSAAERVKLIRRALAFGFTLDELAQILAERSGGKAPCRNVFALTTAKLEGVKNRLREMEMLRDELEELVGVWSGKLADKPENQAVYLLETLTDSENGKSENRGGKSPDNLRRRKRKQKNED